MADLHEFKDWLSAKKTGLHQRQILLLSIPIHDASPLLQLIANHYKHTSVLSNALHIPNTHNISLMRYQDSLGQQTDSLIVDVRDGFHLNAFYACAGMVKINGLIVVLLPCATLRDTTYSNLKFSYGYPPKVSYFNDVFTQQVKLYNGAYIQQKHIYLPSSRVALKDSGIIEPHAADSELKLSNLQNSIANDIMHRIIAHASQNTISVILGPRGRGKSTLLGYIAKHLNSTCAALDNTNKQNNIVVTALHKGQLSVFIDVTASGLAQYKTNTNLGKETDTQCVVKFYALDDIISRAPANAIVFIDEIASIAPELIKQVINYFPHCVLSGTTTGYEGSGNGFVHRVLPYLQHKKDTKTYTLNKPFRWLDDDPVEACLNNILGFVTPQIDLHNAHTFGTLAAHNIRYTIIDKATLIGNTSLYSQVFVLLAQAHYQTSPNDIVRTLDAEDCKIAIAYCSSSELNDYMNRKVVAVAILFAEGGEILAPIANDISLGKRRVQGHLTPQALSLYLLNSEACKQRCLRINRIAVLDEYKRLGIGSGLLVFCGSYAKQQKMDYLSASFGYTPSLYKFWKKSHFLIVKLGHRIDTSSGTASIIMLKEINTISAVNVDLLRCRLYIEYHYILSTNKSLAKLYQTLEEDLLFDKHKGQKKLPNDINSLSNYLAKRAFGYYLNKDISLTKIAPILLWVLNSTSTQLKKEDRVAMLKLLMKFHEKGLHKSEKNEIEKTIHANTKQALVYAL
jgi:tRNA(Met) cytidine acetyltransferase